MTSAEETDEQIKSQNSSSQAFITFVNRTNKPVDIIWRGFNGEFIRYASRLPPHQNYSVNTFVTHPWQAWDSESHRLMNIGGDSVFYPQRWCGEKKRTRIFIDLPVHTLVRFCVELIRSLVKSGDLDSLDIPKPLIDELKNKPTVEEVRDHGGN